MSAQLPPGWSIRPPQVADAAAVHALAIACDIAVLGEPDTDLEDIVHQWSGTDLARDAWLVHGPEGRLAGYAALSGDQELDFEFNIDPAMDGDWLAALLVDRCQARALARLAASNASTQAPLRTVVSHLEAASVRALAASGFHLNKHFFRMQIELAEPPPAPAWPPGWSLRTFRPDREDRDVYRFIRTAFAGDSGRWPDFEEWRAFALRPDHFDPSLWFLLEQGDELLGAATCYDYAPMGWVRHLAVAEAWRRQGIASRLLQHAFGVFYSRGLRRVALGVHSQNPNAVRLYEQCGMRTAARFDQYEKTLIAPHGER